MLTKKPATKTATKTKPEQNKSGDKHKVLPIDVEILATPLPIETSFKPPAQLALLCRFCEKVTLTQLDRSIAGHGRVVDRKATFEYCCTKCYKPLCIAGVDLCNSTASSENVEPKEYKPANVYHIGEIVHHASLKDTGLIVGKDNGKPSRIVVNFEKHGIKKLVENLV